jgi:predicted metal-dependent HD superfamily phosphohydrolase
MKEALRIRFLEHAAALGADAPAAETEWTGIETAYGAPERRYHGLSHLDFLFRELDRRSPAEPLRLAFSAWYHDLVYDPQRGDNEARSAEIAREALPKLGADAGLAERVASLIEATADHLAGGSDADDDLFLDMDFCILGAPAAIYDAYAEGVRQEYAWAPDDLYAAGRSDFLKRALERERLFLTDVYEQEFGDRARKNIARELSALSPESPLAKPPNPD